MCMNLMKLEKQLGFFNQHADFIHVDIMDGHFVKNITLSPFFIEQIRKSTQIPIDAHLMVDDPAEYIDQLIENKTEYITLHAETLLNCAYRLKDRIKSADSKFCLAVSPETDLAGVKELIRFVDKLTIMTVEPGFSGGAFVPEMLKKIKQAHEIRKQNGYSYLIEVDGNCSKKTYSVLKEAHADVFVLGNTGLFSLDENIESAWKKMLKEFNESD